MPPSPPLRPSVFTSSGTMSKACPSTPLRFQPIWTPFNLKSQNRDLYLLRAKLYVGPTLFICIPNILQTKPSIIHEAKHDGNPSISKISYLSKSLLSPRMGPAAGSIWLAVSGGGPTRRIANQHCDKARQPDASHADCELDAA